MRNIRSKLQILLVLFVCLLGMRTDAGQVSVRFGTTTSGGKFKNIYKELNLAPERGGWIDLPVLHGNGCYLWEGIMSGKTVRFAEGAHRQITSDTDFSLIRTTASQISFRSQTGVPYKDLCQKVPSSTWYRLPVLGDSDDLQFLGWSDCRGSSVKTLKPGKMVLAAGDKIYYALFKRKRKQEDTVYLYYGDGTLYKTLKRKKGTALFFPSPYLGENKVLVGWSTRKNLDRDPEYVEDSKIPGSHNIYYMVVSDRDSEPAFLASMLCSPRKYSRMYIIGDSRIAFAKYQFGCTPKNVTFIACPGAGYNWMIGKDPARPGGAVPKLMQYLKDRKKAGLLKGRYAVISEFGINDLNNGAKYVRFYKKLSSRLKQYGCDLYVMSANPLHRGSLEHVLKAADGMGVNTRTMPEVISFNRIIRSGAGNAYRFIDTFTYLKKTGWSSMHPSLRRGDGLHYSAYTGARMINFAILAADNCYEESLLGILKESR